MSSTNTAQLVVEAPLSTLERLAAAASLTLRVASAIQVVASDAEAGGTIRKRAAVAIAERIVRDGVAWGTSAENMQGTLEKLGIARAAARIYVDDLTANALIRDQAEQPNSRQMSETITALLMSDPHLRLTSIRPAGEAAPVVESVVELRADALRSESPVSDHDWPAAPDPRHADIDTQRAIQAEWDATAEAQKGATS